MDFKATLNSYSDYINNELLKVVDGENLPQKKVFDAMAYTLQGGGKRVRPVLVLEFARLAGVAREKALPFALAIEMVHTYSLIHDDLPCMDDDELRRGRPTCHIAYDEATAVLAGDGLLNYAFETMLKADVPADVKLNAISALASASGVYGMIGGQIVDMEGEERALSASELTEMHRMKTGALIRAACEMGAHLGSDEKLLTAARKYADALGRAFQIQDDVLNVIGTAEEMGKDVGNDAESGKSTFVNLLGLDACIKEVNDLTNDAILAVSEISGNEFLIELAKSLATRKK